MTMSDSISCASARVRASVTTCSSGASVPRTCSVNDPARTSAAVSGAARSSRFVTASEKAAEQAAAYVDVDDVEQPAAGVVAAAAEVDVERRADAAGKRHAGTDACVVAAEVEPCADARIDESFELEPDGRVAAA